MLLNFGTSKSRNIHVLVWNCMVIHRVKHYFLNRVQCGVTDSLLERVSTAFHWVRMLLINVNNSNRLCPDRTKQYKNREQSTASTANCLAFGPWKCLVNRPIFVLVCMNRSDEKTHLLYILLSNPWIRDKMVSTVIKSGSRDRQSNPGLSRRKRDGWQPSMLGWGKPQHTSRNTWVATGSCWGLVWNPRAVDSSSPVAGHFAYWPIA